MTTSPVNGDMANETATTTPTNGTATATPNATATDVGGAGPPVGDTGGPPGFVEQASNGLDVAARAAGDAIRNFAPDFVQDLVPFLVIDVFGTVI